VNWILAIPLELRLIGLFVLGAFAGAMANLAAYRLAWNSRHISPWSARDVRAAQLEIPPRRFFDRMPIWWWLGLSREAPLHGRGFWIRPMLVELCCGFGLAWLYWWEVDQAALLPCEIAAAVPASWTFMLHAQFAVHAILIWLMLAASLIDADEKTIPDAITVPGGLLGLLIAAAMPLSLLPAEVIINNLNLPPDAIRDFFWQNVTPQTWSFMTVTAPLAMPPWLGGLPHAVSLLIALACWFLACFALLQRRWYGRHGRFRALVLLCARLRREPSTWRLAFAAAAGGLAIAAVWAFGERTCWSGLLTSLVGMAAAGGLVWAIRIIASAVMRGHGVRRRHAHGHDRRVSRLAGIFDRLLHRPHRRPDRGNRGACLASRQRNPLRAVPLPGGAGGDRTLGIDLALGVAAFRNGRNHPGDDRRLSGAVAHPIGLVANNPPRGYKKILEG